MSSAVHFAPAKLVDRSTLSTCLFWWVLQPTALSTVLQYQSTLVNGIPEWLAQLIGYWNNLGHVISPFIALPSSLTWRVDGVSSLVQLVRHVNIPLVDAPVVDAPVVDSPGVDPPGVDPPGHSGFAGKLLAQTQVTPPLYLWYL